MTLIHADGEGRDAPGEEMRTRRKRRVAEDAEEEGGEWAVGSFQQT
jgi:hypothetical protein